MMPDDYGGLTNERRFQSILVSCIDLSDEMIEDCWSCNVCHARGDYPGFPHKPTCPVAALGRDWRPPATGGDVS